MCGQAVGRSNWQGFGKKSARGRIESGLFALVLAAGQMPPVLMRTLVNIQRNAFFDSLYLSPPLGVGFCSVKILVVAVPVPTKPAHGTFRLPVRRR
jgi:hypothetical protein